MTYYRKGGSKLRISKEYLTIYFFLILTFCMILAVNLGTKTDNEQKTIFIMDEKLSGEKMNDILRVFVRVLATISAFVFTIPLFLRNSREETVYARSDEKYMIIYFLAFIVGIMCSLCAFFRVGPISVTFKFSLIIFLSCLIWLIPYLFVLLKRDTRKVIKNNMESILDDLNGNNNKKDGEKIFKEKIEYMERITLQTLNTHNYLTLDCGIKCFKAIASRITQTPKVTNLENILIKEIMKSFRDLSIACIECKSDEHSRQIGKYMKEIVMDGLQNKQNFEYPNLVLNIEKLGIEAARNHLEETTDEILNSLGQIGNQSIQKDNLQCLPIPAVLKSLQNIGIACTEEKMIHQCATAKTRLLGIAESGDESTRDEALKRLWVVISHIYTNIKAEEESNYEFETMLKKRFGNEFMIKIDDAIQMLHTEGEWVQKRIVREFKDTSQFFEMS
jgi:hypothetical protein